MVVHDDKYKTVKSTGK